MYSIYLCIYEHVHIYHTCVLAGERERNLDEVLRSLKKALPEKMNRAQYLTLTITEDYFSDSRLSLFPRDNFSSTNVITFHSVFMKRL